MATAEEHPEKAPEKASEEENSTPSVGNVGDIEEVRRFEGKVTPEQERTASVARKRRDLAKKRSHSVGRTREQTPVREIPDARSSDNEPAPKTPERRKSKVRSCETTDSDVDTKTAEAETKTITKTPKDDVSSLLAKAKQTAVSKEKSTTTRVLRKDIKKSAIKRSQSAPRPKTGDEQLEDNINNTELVESFKKAQLLSAALELDTPSKDETLNEEISSMVVLEKKPQRPTSIPLFSSNILRRRKLEEERQRTEIPEEIIVVETIKKVPKKEGKRYTFKELRQKWKHFKLEYEYEYAKIRSMRNRCLNDLGLLMIFCGLGAVMFKFTEGTFENFYKCGVKRVKRDFIDALWKGSHHLREDDWKSLARTKLRDFEEQLHTAHEAGVTTYSGQRSWSFLNAIVYALTIVTTIGE